MMASHVRMAFPPGRNPFRLANTENIDTDDDFVRMFGGGVLDVIPLQTAFHRTVHFLSAPGGGKSSLLRLFTPRPLLFLFAVRNEESYADIFRRLEEQGLYASTGPVLMGVKIPCSRSFRNLDLLKVDESVRLRLFYALLDARCTIEGIRGLLTLRGLSFPRDAGKLEMDLSTLRETPPGLPRSASGDIVLRWATDLELRTQQLLDSFLAPPAEAAGHETFYSTSVLDPGCWRISGQEASTKSLIMLDELHELSPPQRLDLLHSLHARRSPVPVWTASRLQILSSERPFEGAISGRDYELVHLEDSWNRSAGGKQFERAMEDIADRRVKHSTSRSARRFREILGEDLDEAVFEDAASRCEAHVLALAGTKARYREWIETVDRAAPSRTRAIEWQRIAILMERDREGQQSTLVDVPRPARELRDLDSSGLRAAAEFFVSRENSIPYYYGFSRLAALASHNVQQFVSVSGDMFDRVLSHEIARKSFRLSPAEEDAIVRDAAHRKWDSIPRDYPNGRDVQALLKAMAECMQEATLRPSAPYAPGVTGIAISTGEHETLKSRSTQRPKLNRLRDALSDAVAVNLLYTVENKSIKGENWTVFYLNALLGVEYGLPPSSSQCQHKTLEELASWLEGGWKPSRFSDKGRKIPKSRRGGRRR